MSNAMLRRNKPSKRRIVGLSLTYVLLLLSAVLYTASAYKRAEFGDSQLDEIFFYMTNGLADGQTVNFLEAARDNLFMCAILFFLLLLPVIDFYRDRIRVHINLATFGNNRTLEFNPSHVSLKLKLTYAVLMFVGALWFLLSSFHAMEFIRSLSQSNQIFEQHYVDPKTVSVTFPEKKRNLVYIYMESMENTPAATKNGGHAQQSRIPELEALALDKDNTSFSNQPSGLGGALPVTGTTWTAAGMVAQSAGVPLKHQLFNTDDGGQRAYKSFLPGAYTLGDMLKKAGYNQTFLMGSSANFGGRNTLLKEHGDYTILDYDAMKANGTLPKDYKVWWGYEDRKLFEYAQTEATRLAAEGKPFNLQMLTADTHFTDGYLDPTCPTPYAAQYDNVHACSSARVAEFVKWIQAQPFGDNTTIVLSGDHLGMQTSYYDGLTQGGSYQRTVYNAFINAAATTDHTHSRLFSTLDMYPTTVAALGGRIPGDRLGLGVNLFSDQKTLIETYGNLDALNSELETRSGYYESKILNGK